MRAYWIMLFTVLALGSCEGAVEPWSKWFVPELGRLEAAREKADAELAGLGSPVVGLTAPEIGYQREHVRTPPLTADWLQIDLGQSRVIDTVALIPAVLDWQSSDHPAYGFPLRFQVAISDDSHFEKFSLVANFTDEDFPNPGIAAVPIAIGGKTARYVRISILKLAQENQLYFCALSEIMVISRNLNVAIGCPVQASASVEIPPRFSMRYLVDGRSHLGPPILRDYLAWDGLHAGEVSNDVPPFMQLDLGRAYPLQQVIIHPLHARRGADVPGFRFPRCFRVEASDNANFSNAVVLMDAQDYSNPGNNPITIPCEKITARYIKMTALFKGEPGGPRFSLSEIQVYSGDHNVALGAEVTRTPDNFPSSKNWPVSLLVDGYTSYGRLLELPDWLRRWDRRRVLEVNLKQFSARESALAATAHQRAVASASGLAVMCVVCVAAFGLASRIRVRRELQMVRGRLARDIHDHIGSNLAGIAVLSEVSRDHEPPDSPQRADWNEVHQIVRETLDVMREVIWLIGDKKGAELDLMTQMQLAASRMLTGREYVWKAILAEMPAELSPEARRDIFLFFKEALTNIVRHSEAHRIKLSLSVIENSLQLSVIDDGRGFEVKSARSGVGLNSQRLRARALGGTVRIVSNPGAGTEIYLQVPLNRIRRHLGIFHR